MENETTVPVVNQPSTPMVQPVAPGVTIGLNNFNYASFGRRLLAGLVDTIVLSFVYIPLSLISSIATAGFSVASTEESPENVILVMILSTMVSLIQIGIGALYYVYFTGSRGQTLGKMALGIKVVKADTQEVPGYTSAFLRETIGKFVSSLILALGYLWMIWDPKKQTWHDKIANTIVIRT